MRLGFDGRHWKTEGECRRGGLVQRVTLAWAVWTLSVNLEVTAGAQGRRATCLPSSLATHPLSWYMTFGKPSPGEPTIKALLSTPSHKILPCSDLYCSFINYSSWKCASRGTGLIDMVCASGRVLRVIKDRKWKWGGLKSFLHTKGWAYLWKTISQIKWMFIAMCYLGLVPNKIGPILMIVIELKQCSFPAVSASDMSSL